VTSPKWRKLVVGVVAAAVAASVAVFTQPAFAGVVGGVTVSPVPATAGASSTYSIGFTTSANLQSGDTITLSGPAGTVFPLVAGDYSVGGNTVAATPTQSAASNVTLATPVTLSSTSVTVTGGGVTNPSLAGSAYTMIVGTSIDTPGVSAPYTISPATGDQFVNAAGDHQSAAVGTAFGLAFSVTVEDQFHNPVPGAMVTFTAPASGASGSFSGSTNTITATSGAGGVATTSPHSFTANGTAGVYNITATSGAASFSWTATNITVPGAPVIDDAVAGDQSATVHWSAPVSDGFANVTGYVITASNGAQLVVGDVKSATFGGLINNDSYTFKVAAINAAGIGPYSAVTNTVSPTVLGYWTVASDGGVFSFGNPYFGSEGGTHLNSPIVGMARTVDGGGYWLVAADGGIFTVGDAVFYGSMGNRHLNQPIVGMAVTADGGGYWLAASDGGVFTFGDATYHGSMGGKHLNRPIVGMANDSGSGYWLVASDGGIFAFGGAGYYGSTGAMVLNKPIVGMASPSSKGYWLVASDGGIFTFGSIGFFGSAGNIPLNKPIVGMVPTPDGQGYWLAASDGGIFNYGKAGFFGSTAGMALNQPVVGIG
jgi:hypothetical protein